jgi:hypothetical protein
MSAATLREEIIAQLRIADAVGRVYRAPAAWQPDNANANAKPLAECIANAVIPEIQNLGLLNVKQRFDPTPNLPVAPTVGDVYQATATAHGWTVNRLYTWTGTVYTEQIPDVGLEIWIKNINTASIWTGTEWIDLGTAAAEAVASVDGRTGVVTLADLYAPIAHALLSTTHSDTQAATPQEDDILFVPRGYYSFAISIDKTKVGGSIGGYVYAFTDAATSVPAGFFTHVADAGGLDIRFFDTDNLTELKRTIVYFSAGTSKCEIHVQIPAINTASNKVIYCRYGTVYTRANDSDTFAATDRYYPLQTATPTDYGPNGSSGSSTLATVVDGKVGKGLSLANTTSRLDGGLEFNAGSTWSIGLWIKVASTGQNKFILTRGYYNNGVDKNYYRMWLGSDGKLNWTFAKNGQNDFGGTTPSAYDDNAWHHLVFVCASNTSVLFYADGQYVETWNISGYIGTYTGYATIFGNWFGYGAQLNGLVDSIRYYVRQLSAAEILTIYNNENSQNSFASCGAEAAKATPTWQRLPKPTGSASLKYSVALGVHWE